MFDVTDGNLDAVARVDRLEWKRNLDNVKGDRNSNPYAILALADREIVADAGANAWCRGGRRRRGLRVELQRASPKDAEEEPLQGRGRNAGQDHPLAVEEWGRPARPAPFLRS